MRQVGWQRLVKRMDRRHGRDIGRLTVVQKRA
jgi:hypothetical protein